MVNGKSVARLSLATSQSWKDKNTGEFRLTKNGNKMLTGKVADPYQGDGFKEKSASNASVFEDSNKTTDDIPF